VGELSCEDARRAIWLLVDGELSGEKAEVLRRHLDVCEVCQREHRLARKETAVLRGALGEWVEEMPARRAAGVRSASPKMLAFKVLVAVAAAVLLFLALGRRDHGPEGMLMVKRLGAEAWEAVGENVVLGPGDSLVTGGGWRASFYLTPETRLAIKERTEVRFSPERLMAFRLVRGEVWVKSGSEERVIVSVGELSVEGAGAEFVVSGGMVGDESRLSLVPTAWAVQSNEYDVAVLEGEVVVRAGESESVLRRGKRLAWRGKEMVSEELGSEEVRRLRWVEGSRDPYSGRAVDNYNYVALNPFSVNPRESIEKGEAR